MFIRLWIVKLCVVEKRRVAFCTYRDGAQESTRMVYRIASGSCRGVKQVNHPVVAPTNHSLPFFSESGLSGEISGSFDFISLLWSRFRRAQRMQSKICAVVDEKPFVHDRTNRRSVPGCEIYGYAIRREANPHSLLHGHSFQDLASGAPDQSALPIVLSEAVKIVCSTIGYKSECPRHKVERQDSERCERRVLANIVNVNRMIKAAYSESLLVRLVYRIPSNGQDLLPARQAARGKLDKGIMAVVLSPHDNVSISGPKDERFVTVSTVGDPAQSRHRAQRTYTIRRRINTATIR
jgi:hypothetical protein